MNKSGHDKRVYAGIPTFGKTDIRYWRDRIYKPVSVRAGGVRVTGDHYAVKLQANGKRMTLGLQTANKEEAARRACRMHLDLVAGGWDLFLEKHRPKPSEPERPESKYGLTIGEYVAMLRSKNLLSSKAIDGYMVRLRVVAGDIAGIEPTTKKYGKGHDAWVEKVDAVPLASLTPEKVRLWKTRQLNKADNQLERQRATITVNSTLRQARSLFGERKVLRFLQIPRPHPFEGVEFEPRVSTKFYGAGVDAPTLLALALEELDPERLKAFLLALCAGLRRKEADLLEWSSFDFANSTVQVKRTEYYVLKTTESEATLALDPEITALFRAWYAQRRSQFVIESANTPRPGANYYRCNHVFDSLSRWLRSKGVTGDKPFHVLRKMFGSLIVEKAGIFAASSALRHTSIELTNAYYVDRTVRTTSGLGGLVSKITSKT